MAIKVLLVLGALLMAGSALFGVLNRQMYIDQKQERIDEETAYINKKKELQKTEDELADAEAKLKDLKRDRDASQAKLTNAKSDLEAKERALDKLKKELADAEAELKKWEPIIQEAGQTDLAGLNDKVESMKEDLTNKNAELQKVENEVADRNRTVDGNADRLDGLAEEQEKRRQGIARNAFEATITAVNPDWGFVIIGAGKNRDIRADKPLLVVSGGRMVARLSVISVEDSITVADVVPDSVSPGAAVQPGQQVIYEEIAN